MSPNLVRYWLRRNTTTQWEAQDPVLGDGEVGLATDTGHFRLGDGVTRWTDLPNVPQDSIDTRIVSSGEDRANTGVACASNAYGYLPARCVLPPSDHDWLIEYGGSLLVTTAGSGAAGVGIAETQTGTLVQRDFVNTGYLTWTAGGTFNNIMGSFSRTKRLPKSDSWRNLRMINGCFKDSGALVAQTAKSSSVGSPTYLEHDRAPYIIARPA